MGSTADKVAGAANEAIGKAKQGAGEAVGSDRLQSEGAAPFGPGGRVRLRLQDFALGHGFSRTTSSAEQQQQELNGNPKAKQQKNLDRKKILN